MGLTEGGWARTRSELPLFRTDKLVQPDVLHSDNCGTRLDDNGTPVGRRCTCYATCRKLSPGQVVQVVLLTDTSALVDPLTGAPCWIEREGLYPDKRPKIEEIRRRNIHLPPPDYSLLDTALLEGPLSLARRQRTPHGGEIVFLRAEMKDPKIEAEPLRLLCQILRNDAMTAVLIDPQLTFDQALSPAWTQRREVPLLHEEKPITLAQAFIPAYPLPNGEENPGWIPYDRQRKS